MTTTPAPQQHPLQHIAEHWPRLRDMLDTHHGAPWPPAGRMADYLAQLDAADREAVRAARAAQRAAERSPDQLGDRPVPVRLDILDTMRALDAVLLQLADQIAAEIQRPAYGTPRRSAGPLDELGQRMRLVQAADEADARRWHWNGPGRDSGAAAAWLHARIENQPGPFAALDAANRERIERLAAEAAERLDAALDLVRRAQTLDRPCPYCRGELHMHSGDGQPPAVICASCGRTWRETEPEKVA
ncbi:hypothetical protein DMB38_12900 [Streptomyces sp. WAC 06738]|uniref:hypothetical protein n=1 Tax=Streptomyces sp. WAC 06738 TaxID=2203210 RepID=UPI000F6DFC6A|nr:hypothetical protein [Streptomyces sp. WAC 06738]AZM46592.1 hypothetical protein DMB38_12900 [Streptomyces sp. WAC 06738]